jgi:asparagine synthase (glutamine-hydrolysing)
MPEEEALAKLKKMVRAIHHESFYVCGIWKDPSLGVYVGWVARKGSFSENMPLTNETGDVTLMFSGEDHPPPGTRELLRERGHNLPITGAFYLVHLYEEHATFPACLNGFFHGIVVDRRRQTATLFNDRYGLQRLYCHQWKDSFYFAAEAKAILSVCPETRVLDSRGLSEFISLGCVLQNRSLFAGIDVVPPASAWVFRNKALTSRGEYFSPREWEEQKPLDAQEYYCALRNVISREFPKYISAQEPVALALTGGLDTRVIMACANAAPGSLPCYTFGGSLRESQDVVIGRQVAGVCRQLHQVLPVGVEFLSRFPHYAERTTYLSDGCVTVANSPDLYLSERAREIAPLKVVGTWGSELLRNTVTFKPTQPEVGLLQPELLMYLERAEVTYEGIRNAHPVTFGAFRQTPWAQYGIEALEQTQVGIRAPFLDNNFVRTIYRAPQPSHADVRARLIADASPALARIPSDRGIRAQNSGGLASAPARLFQEFTFKAEYLFDIGMPQWLARIDGTLSPLKAGRLFLGRHKFLHFNNWYRYCLAGYVKQILLDPLTLSRPYLRSGQLQHVVHSHTRGVRNYTRTIHWLLTLELIQRQLVSSEYSTYSTY